MKLSVPFRRMTQRWWPGRLATAVLLCCSLQATLPAAITYVQSNSADPQSPQSTVNVTFTAAQTAGNLNVVVVGWNDSTATVATVTDSKGNAYQVAVGPTVQSGVATQSTYYAKNIVAAAAGSNIVKVTFASAAAFPDIRIIEYSGADLVNPVDVTAAAIGNSSSSNSGSATTTNATDLIFGANLVQTGTTGAGAGFTSRVLTSPDADIAEDRSVTAVGSYSATAPVSPSGQWIMQMVAFRTPQANVAPPTAPTNLTATVVSATQINLSWTPSSSSIGIANYVVQRCQGAGCSNFAQVGTPAGTTFNNTGLAPGTIYNYQVQAKDTAGTLSGFSNVSSGTTQTPPTAPGTPTLTVVSATQINLSWTASTSTVGLANYIVQRCQGASCANFAQVGTPAGTTLNDIGLTAGTSYSYQLQAKDTAGNLSGFSSIATASTQTPPTAPSNLTLNVVSTTQINLSWTASTSTVGLANYIVQRCQGVNCVSVPANFAQIASFPATTTAYNDSTLTASTSYSYRVQASDTSGNLSAFSNTGTATTQGPPTAPSNLTTTVASATQINLSWTASSSSIGLANYIVQRCQGVNCASVPANFAQVGTPAGTTFNDTGLTAGTSYSYQVQGKDTSGNLSGFSNTSTATTQTPPTAPGTPTLTVVSATQINLSWTASTSAVGLANYVVQRCQGAGCSTFAQAGTPAGTTFNDTSLTAGTSYSYQVQAKDTSGNLSAFSSVATASTQTPPTAPGTPTLTVVSATQINLSWTASTSTVGLANYIVQRCQAASCSNVAQVGTPAGTTFNDTGLTAGTSYSYQVQAKDTSGNLSGFSSISTASTQTPPTVPGTPTLTVVSNTQINLIWTASTSTVGLANYIVQRCQGASCSNFAQAGTPAGTTFNDTGLTASTSYSYRVQAGDTSGNLSAFSNTATASTTGPPTTPTNLTATPAGTTQINLSWTASTSSVGLANYIVQRCQNAGCSNFAQVATPAGTTYNDTGLTPNTSYSYQVQAIDTAGGLSPFSNISTAVTQTVVTTITFVQANSTDPQTSPTSVSVLFTSAQTAGDLIVAAVGWNNTTATVSSVNDTSGNNYQLAVGPTVQAGVATQSIYVAKNIKAAAAGANTVTVTFSAAAAFPDIRVLEYKGADPVNPVDVTVAATGSSATSDSGFATTTNPTDLIFGANTIQTSTTGAGANFTSRIITSPDSDIAEDRMVTATGSYSATAPVSPAGQWIMQMVAIRTGSAGPPQPPTAPTNLTATAASVSQINLSWTASSSSIGIANYIVQRCQGVGCSNFAQVGTPSGTTFNDTGLTQGTSYSYQVQAKDTAGTLGGFSNVASATTLAPQPPTAPTNLTATATSASQINLSWTASTSSVGLANYIVQRCQGAGCSNFAQAGTPTGTTFNDTGLTAGTSYSYQVQAKDTSGTLSAFSTPPATAITQTPPTAPGIPTLTVVSATQINLSWAASTSTVGLANYIVQRCQGASCNSFAQAGTPAGTTFNDTGLTAGTSYSYQVQAKDTSGNLSAFSGVASASTQTPPTTPGTPTLTVVSNTQINLSWTASTSTVGLANYIVQRCQGASCSDFAQVGTPAGTTFNDTSLTASTSYSYRVQASDTSGNLSAFSNTSTASTTGPPTAPTNLTATPAGTTQINLSWTASTSSVGLANYIVQRCQNAGCSNFAQVATPAGTTYNDTGLTPNSSYSYQVQAVDTAGGLSPFSNVATAVTQTVVTTVTFVQGNSTDPQTSPTSVSVAFTSAQTAGNLIVAAVGWNNTTATVSSLNDTSGNVYQLAVGPTVQAGVATQSIYVAKNIKAAAAGANTVTVMFSAAAAFPDIRILEYSGADPANPVDVTAAAIGSSATSDSGFATTTNPTDLIFGANTIQTSTTGAGASFTSRIITSPDSDIVEDRMVTATGSYSATAPLSPAGQWIMQMVAFRTGSGGPPPPPAFTVTPRTSTLTPILTQQFTTNGSGVAWSVDGVAGGSPATGTITNTGLYTPPATPGIHNVTASTTSPPQQAAATVYVTNYGGTFTRDIDNLRTGLNSHETVLNPSNVNSLQFGKLFNYAIDGTADASPLYVPNVNIPGKGSHNVVYVATEHDSVYAFDADGRQTTPLWQLSFINPAAGITTVPPNDTGECCDISPEIGITGTPVIDPATNTLYVVVKTKEVVGGSTNYYHRLHSLDLATGAEKLGGPVFITATLPGNGAGSVNGQITFLNLRQNQRSALLLNNGVVYIAFGAHGDNSPYHGWILGYNASTLQRVMAYMTSPNDNGIRSTGGGQGSGVWMSGDGLAADAAGNIFFVTGNGNFDVNTGGPDYGDSLLQISPTGTVLDYFTPHNQQYMNDQDIDLGSGGTLVLPDQPGTHPHLALTAGKGGTIYLIDRDNMGHYNPNNDNAAVQTIVNIFPNGNMITGNFKAPVYWNGHLYYSADADFIKTFSITNGLLSTSPTSQSSWAPNYPGATLGMSSNGNSNAILWAIQRVDFDPFGGGTRGPGSLHAFDATNLANELYTSNQNAARDQLDFTAKWSAPLVANGKVFVASEGFLTGFGLLP